MSTKLRGKAPRRSGPYPLGEIPYHVIVAIARKIVHRLAVGIADIEGNDFGTIFAAAVERQHRGKPLGVADVELGGCAWSVKTVKSGKPFSAKRVRLISGRNAPVFSQDIKSPLADIGVTGRAVLEIWNARVDEAYAVFDDLRIFVLTRNIATLEFLVTEHEAHRFQPDHYKWALNKRGNLEGFELETGAHYFTWQPHGAQFTILHRIPQSARRFKIVKHPKLFAEEGKILDAIGFDESWIQTVNMPS